VGLYLHSPNTPSWRGARGEHRDREEVQGQLLLQNTSKIFWQVS
jgi:hypothetical protein